MTVPIIEVENIHKKYRVNRTRFFGKDHYIHAVNGITFKLYEGESFGLVGESGSGKSTTGQIILQLIEQTNGSVKYKGKNVSEFTSSQLKKWRKDVQIVFQDPYSSLNPKKTIQWILNEPLKIHKVGNRQTQLKKIVETLEDVGLDSSYLKRYPHELSGGQRQRVAIASSIILQPKFIVIDEGVSALDVSVQAQILNLLKQLQKKYQLTYLFISHDLNVVQYFCDRIAIMYLGEIVEVGKTEDFSVHPKHPYAQALFASIPTLDDRNERIILKGEIPNSVVISKGCPFYSRCSQAMDICKTTKPVAQQLGKDHYVRCYLYQNEGDNH